MKSKIYFGYCYYDKRLDILNPKRSVKKDKTKVEKYLDGLRDNLREIFVIAYGDFK